MAIYSSRLTLGRNSPAKDLISGSGLWDSVKISFSCLNRWVCGNLLWQEQSKGRVYFYFYVPGCYFVICIIMSRVPRVLTEPPAQYSVGYKLRFTHLASCL